MGDASRQLLTIAQVAAQLACSREWVLIVIHTGRLPAYRLGRHYRVRQSELDAFVMSLIVDPLPESVLELVEQTLRRRRSA